MSTLEIINLVILLVVGLGLGIYYLIKAIKNHWIKQLIDTLEHALKEAEEKYPHGHGAEKNAMVLAAVRDKCEELGIPYLLLSKIINKLIDDYIKKYNLLSK